MQNYCYKCMHPLQDAMVCPQCGCNNAALPTADAPYHLPRGTMLENRYLVGSVIGEGGFGITYIGLDTTLSKRVAVKEFYPSGAANRTNTISGEVLVTQGKEDFFARGVERFLFEAKNIAAFSEEEGIVYVLDYFQENGTAYIVMEFLEGETLKDHVNHYGKFMMDRLLPLLLPVMRSLGTMHAKGIIHRDISPDNIMYTKRGKLKLMDFGSARYYTNAEREMSVILKQGFAPEEQYRQNTRQGPYTDVYALCATIYACITGTVPVSSLDRLARDTLLAPSQLGISIQPHQERALMHGLALRKENRTPDMETLIREFTVPAATQPATYRPQQWQQPQQPPQWQQPVTGQPAQQARWQQQPVTMQPQPRKKSKAPLIIAAIAAVVVIGGGIVAGIMIFGGGQSRGNNPLSSIVISQTDSSDSRTSSSRIASSSASSQFSDAQSSVTESSAVSSGAHYLFNENGVIIMEDIAIDTNDARAEQLLKNYMEENNTDASTDELSYSYDVAGNTLVLQYQYLVELTDEQISMLETTVATLKTNSNAKNFKSILQSETGVSNAQLVYAYFDIDGNFLTSVLVD